MNKQFLLICYTYWLARLAGACPWLVQCLHFYRVKNVCNFSKLFNHVHSHALMKTSYDVIIFLPTSMHFFHMGVSVNSSEMYSSSFVLVDILFWSPEVFPRPCVKLCKNIPNQSQASKTQSLHIVIYCIYCKWSIDRFLIIHGRIHAIMFTFQTGIFAPVSRTFNQPGVQLT